MAKERVLENLILEDEDYIFGGDLLIKGNINLTNCSLIVSGTLEVMGDIHIIGGDIVCEVLDCLGILIRDGDICVKDLTANDNIDSNRNIEVNGDSYTNDVKALNYLVSGNNNSDMINTTQDTYILGNNDSVSITARDIFIYGNCDLNGGKLTAKNFEYGGKLVNYSDISVG